MLGASGSGKSSLVQAGIIPYLADQWGVSKLERFTCVPDINPFASLYNCLPNEYKNDNPLGKKNPNPNNNQQLIEFIEFIDKFKKSCRCHRWIIFIDQFEEIFTSTSSKPKRDGFIANLVALMRKHYSSVKLVLAMRSDFIDNLREYGDLTNEIESKIRLMRELTESELRLAIAEPAARNGVTFEPGLVEQIMRDFHQQAGSLPLLQYTLDLLWEKDRIGPEKRILQLETYENLGGVSGALEKQANEIYQQQLNHEEKKAAAKIFIQLIDLIDLAVKKPVTRRVERSKLTRDPIKASTLTKLIKFRLLVSGREQSTQVEVAHEELLRSWGFIQNLIQQQEEILILRNRLISDTERWHELRQENPELAKDELWIGSKLERVLELLDEKALENLEDLHQQFIQASVHKRDGQRREKEEQRQRELAAAKKLAKAEEQARREAEEREKQQQEDNKKLRRRAIFLAVAFVGAAIASVIAWNQSKQVQLSQADSLARYSLFLFNEGKNLDALLEAIRAGKILQQYKARDLEVMGASIGNIYSGRERNRLEGHDDAVSSISISPDGKTLANCSSDKTIKLWDVQTGAEIRTLSGHDNWVNSLSFSPDGKTLASGSEDNTIKLWEYRRSQKSALSKDTITQSIASVSAPMAKP